MVSSNRITPLMYASQPGVVEEHLPVAASATSERRAIVA
jgi:hypothetical protein